MKLYVKCDRCEKVSGALSSYQSETPRPPDDWATLVMASKVGTQEIVRKTTDVVLCGVCADIIHAVVVGALRAEAVPA